MTKNAVYITEDQDDPVYHHYIEDYIADALTGKPVEKVLANLLANLYTRGLLPERDVKEIIMEGRSRVKFVEKHW
jgi:hypothetical protein